MSNEQEIVEEEHRDWLAWSVRCTVHLHEAWRFCDEMSARNKRDELLGPLNILPQSLKLSFVNLRKILYTIPATESIARWRSG